MFTIKHLLPDGTQFITGPFDSVEMVRDNDHPECWVVRGLKDRQDERFQVGPYAIERDEKSIQPKVWVMNDAGATVAMYTL